ncbi:MAG: tRNA pseudouridine(38-40) synthase TruA [Ruminococcaceae bacterium]|nr:tRNA pseudouridine(38-40) synthase TruA [Oscillospiraceae bacterium]
MDCPAEHSQDRRKIAILVEYDGSAFSGWQYQPRERTVQKTLTEALMQLTGDTELSLIGCSRTDTGVHARGHVSHFLTSSPIPDDRWPLALNRILPEDISVHQARTVPDCFHARFGTCSKRYSYSIWNHRVRPALKRHRCSHVPGALDIRAMAAALPYMLGKRDYRAFQDAGSEAKTTVRTIQRVRLLVSGPEISFFIQGDGFLYHMVRIMVGTLLAVAQNKLTAASIGDIILAGDRRLAGKTMPPQGLCLEIVLYEPAIFDTCQEPAAREGEIDVQYALE